MADLLNIGQTGLFAAKKALATTGHNLSNANTEGYSRQKVNQTTNLPVIKQGHIMGTGTRVKSITRHHDPFLEKRLNHSLSEHHFNNERFEQLNQIEDLFNEIDAKGLTHLMAKFYNSFRKLANQPENETVRSIVRDNANLVIKDVKKVDSSLNHLTENIDKKIRQEVDNINHLTKQVAYMNRKIAELEVVDGETGDLRDERDRALRTLAESFHITTYLDDNNHFVVNAKGVGTLVSATEVQEFRVKSLDPDSTGNGYPGSVEVFLEGKPSVSLSKNFHKGRLSSLIDVRNNDLKNLKSNVNEVAYELIQTVNAIHKRGYANRPIPTTPDGQAVQADQRGPTTGILFFHEAKDLNRANAASRIDLSSELKNDLSNLCAALAPNAPGDNRVAIAISKLQHEKILEGGTTTLEEQYLQTVANIGVETGKAQLDTEHSEGLLAQARSLRERLVGVSIDEETANLVRYQHSYDAAAKVMKAADEMFQTVLNIKR